MKRLLFLIILFPFVSNATNYYIDPTLGSNSNTGTSPGSGNAWASVSKLSGSFSAGDNIYLKRGETFTSTQISIASSGSSGNPITIGAYGTGERPKLTGNGSTRAYLFYLNSISYVIIRDIWIIDPTIDTTLTGAARNVLSKIERSITFDNSTNHCGAINVKFSGVGLAVYMTGNSTNNLYDSCYANDLTMIVDDVGGTNDFGANFWVLTDGANNNIITHNMFIRCYSHSYDFTFDGGSDIYASNNTIISYNFFYDCLGITEFTTVSTGTVFSYNIVVNCGEAFCFQNNGITISLLNNNFIQTVTPRPGASNNLINQCGGSSHTAVIKNNLFHLTAGLSVATSGTGNTHENNIYRVSGGGSVGYSLGGSEASTTDDFWKVQIGNPLNWDYSVPLGSPEINFGQNLSLSPDFNGVTVTNPPEAGALEYVADIVPPVTPTKIRGLFRVKM